MKEEKFQNKITPKGTGGLKFKETFAYKDLIFLFVRREYVANYKQTILGPLWAIVQPLLSTFVYAFVFGHLANLDSKEVPSYLFYMSGTILWIYFSTSLTKISNTFIDNRRVLAKVYFPRLVMPISTILSRLISFGIQFVLFMLLWCYYALAGSQVAMNWYVLMTPLIVLQFALLAMGVGVIISSLTVKYRDLGMLVTFGVELWKYLSPIAYDMNTVGLTASSGLYAIYMLNPITPSINLFRYAFFSVGGVDWTFYHISWAITLLIFFGGVLLFNKVERTFADTV